MEANPNQGQGQGQGHDQGHGQGEHQLGAQIQPLIHVEPEGPPVRIRIPTHIEKFTGAATPTAKNFFAQVEDYFLIQQPPDNLQPLIAAQLLGGAAQDWYNTQYRPTAAGKTYQQFKEATQKHFSTRDEDEMARRKQRILRVLPLNPLNMVASVNMFNTTFTNNQVHIDPQATRDTYLAYIDCIRNSVASYPDALQLLQLVTTSMNALGQEKQTLEQVQNAAAASAPTVVDTATGTTRPTTPRQPTAVPSGNLHTMTIAPAQRIAGVRRGRNARGEPTICNYCHTGDTHQSARAKTDTGYNGEVLCPQLKEDLAAGRIKERIPGRKYPRTNMQQSLNSYGRWQNVIDPTTNNNLH
jgi:hypothetical protein